MLATKLQAARLLLTRQFPYYSHALFGLQVYEHPLAPGFISDEHWRVFVNSQYVEMMKVPEMAVELLHQLEHLLRQHHRRMKVKSRDSKLFNLAADIAVCETLERNSLPLPGGSPTPRTVLLPDGKTPEEYYRLLLSVTPTDGRFRICGSFSEEARLFQQLVGGIDGEFPGLPESNQALIRRATAEEIANAGKAPADMPGLQVRSVPNNLDSLLDWRLTLRQEASNTAETVTGDQDFTYRRRNRRQNAYGSYRRPALVDAKITASVIVDTSGSITGDQLSQILAEVKGLLRTSRIARLTVYSVDADVQTVQQIFRPEDIVTKGGGGTRMDRGIEIAAKESPTPDLIVVLTDGHTPWPESPVYGPRKVIACILPGGAVKEPPPWIRTIRIQNLAA